MSTIDVLLSDGGDLPHYTRHGRGPVVTLQRIELRLRTFLGEWLLDSSKGLPYLAWIAAKPPQVEQIGDVIRAEVETTPGVISVDSWSVTRSRISRRFTISASITVEDLVEPVQVEIMPLGTVGNSSPAILWTSGQGPIIAGGTV